VLVVTLAVPPVAVWNHPRNIAPSFVGAAKFASVSFPLLAVSTGVSGEPVPPFALNVIVTTSPNAAPATAITEITAKKKAAHACLTLSINSLLSP